MKLNDPSAVKANRDWLQKAIVTGEPFPPGTLYVDGTVEADMTVGCGSFVTTGPRPMSFESQTDSSQCRWINQLGEGPVFRVTNGFRLANIGLIGDGKSPAIEVLGNTKIPTGRCHFSSVAFQQWRADVATTNTPEENHADNIVMVDCIDFNTGVTLECNNIQGFNLHIIRPDVNYLPPPAAWNKPTFSDHVIVKVLCGGRVTVDTPAINHPRCKIFETHKCNTNANQLVVRNFQRDLFDPKDHASNWLTILDNPGGEKWIIDASGHVPLYHGFDKSKLFPDGVPANCEINIPGVMVRRRAAKKLEAK